MGDPTPKVLVLEDEAIIGLMLAAMIADAGLSVAGPYASPRAALAALDHDPIGAAMLDVNLGPHGDSYPVAAELARRKVPFAFLTAYAARSIRPEFRSVPVLQKPVAPHALRATIGALLAPGQRPPEA